MTKIISLSDNAYDELKAMKQGEDSFSEVVIRLVDKAKQRSLKEFLGKWPGKEKEAIRIKETLRKERKHFRLHEVKF